MLEWLFRSEFDASATVAIWSIAAVLTTTVALFVYTLGLRLTTIVGTRRRARTVRQWRSILASAVLSADAAGTLKLPIIRANNRTDVMEEWNRLRDTVGGDAADNLILLGQRMGLPAVARKRLRRRRIQSKILALQTLGHLRDAPSRSAIASYVAHPNLALSITAAVALVDIDAETAIETLIPMIAGRRDWPRNRVSLFLRMAGSELISEPMYRAIRSAKNEDKTYLLQFVHLVEPEVLEALVIDIIRGVDDPSVLSAALKLVRGYSGVPRLAALTRHRSWYVRMQAAKVLGRIGQKEHLSFLESLLRDREWWVRYRAAQAIASLPFMGPNSLRRLRDQQQDHYAADMLQQAMAEVGLA
ncbi:MAG: HEAT repeat domain-containing protein [Gammaproteobacteria bacterium]|nr:HEAT repeat domain-containing protein [Gammaproteobacteria bacterium]MDH4315010.1 HEAT repeat domain-containing protein [Gammaproteobacteria bacterium]MDH5501274.1 HEAT repeat domain-containing protein [Gammaproteobacteria bacterium]